MLSRGMIVAAIVVGFVLGYTNTPPLLGAMASTDIAIGAVFNGPWKTRLDLARADTPFFVRAAVAEVGLGANQSIEALYWTTSKDSDGNPLRGGQTYTIEIPARMPEVAFWSITAYDAEHYLIDNELNHYAITDRMYDAGATEVSFGPQPVSNSLWLPNIQSDQNVTLILRMYQPSGEFLAEPTGLSLPTITRQQ